MPLQRHRKPIGIRADHPPDQGELKCCRAVQEGRPVYYDFDPRAGPDLLIALKCHVKASAADIPSSPHAAGAARARVCMVSNLENDRIPGPGSALDSSEFSLHSNRSLAYPDRYTGS